MFTLQLQQAAHAVHTVLTQEQRDKVLLDLADLLLSQTEAILKANHKDLVAMDVSDPKYDRLQLNPQRIQDMAQEVRNVVALPSPLGKVLYEHTIQPGLQLRKVTVPLGVVCMIYEARPNVTLDAFVLCFKSGNACVLKGGKEAVHTNLAILHVIHDALKNNNLSTHFATYLAVDRNHMTELLKARTYIDVVIPRGSQQLIQYVRENATIPVIETGAGVVHTYIDKECAIDIAQKVIFNAKTRRVSVCNALDCILIHRERLKDLYAIVEPLQQKEVIIYADEMCLPVLKEAGIKEAYLKPATKDLDGHEFLDYKILVKCVEDINQAIEHINHYGSKHSEAIISTNAENITQFQTAVDASTIYVNASTAFTDGAQFGLGAEIGISTQKLHARGPMALEALTTTKYLVIGTGHVRG